MKGRTKKERRAIGKLVRWIRKQKKREFDRFFLDDVFGNVIAVKSSEVDNVGRLMPTPIEREHDDFVMAFHTMMYANAVISESKGKAYALPVINNVDQIYTLHGNNT